MLTTVNVKVFPQIIFKYFALDDLQMKNLLTLSLVIILDESASLIQPLRGPLEASSVSTTLMRSGLYVLASSSSCIDLRFPDPISSSSSGLRNRERNRPRPAAESSSSSSAPYDRPKFVRLLLSSLLYRFSPKRRLVGGDLLKISGI